MMLIALALTLGCAKPTTPAPPTPDPEPVETEVPTDSGPLGTDHPLYGKIWSTADAAFVERDVVYRALEAADYALLGEKHDNPEHHVLQARAIEAIAETGTRVAFEHLDREDPVDATTPAALAEAVNWAESGWPDFEMFEPVFASVFKAGATVVAGHPTRADLKEGIDGLPAKALTTAGVADLTQQIIDSHCGHAPENLIDIMIAAQTLKDAYMAQSLGDGGILIAGGGHTRKDRGVPYHLEGTSVTLAFWEVSEGEDDPAAYVTSDEADFVWFTSRMDNEDPCEAFRKSLEGMNK